MGEVGRSWTDRPQLARKEMKKERKKKGEKEINALKNKMGNQYWQSARTGIDGDQPHLWYRKQVGKVCRPPKASKRSVRKKKPTDREI